MWVDDKLAKEKLINEVIAERFYTPDLDLVLELIRNTDLTDCQQPEHGKLYVERLEVTVEQLRIELKEVRADRDVWKEAFESTQRLISYVEKSDE